MEYPLLLCDPCLGLYSADADKPPHHMLTGQSRITRQAITHGFLCTNCGRKWDRLATGWFEFVKRPTEPGPELDVPTEHG